MDAQEKIEKMLKKTEAIINAGKPRKHPYTCAITGLEVDRPCWECVIYKQLDSNCEWRPKKHKRKHQILKAVLLDKRWEYLKHLIYDVNSACGIGAKV